MGRGISLERYAQTRVFIPGRGEGFRLQIQAGNNVLMPAEIFLFSRRMIDPRTELEGDDFECVCSPFDLTIYPVDDPDPDQSPAYFRKSLFDYILPSQTVAEETFLAIHEEVCVLVEAMNKFDTLELVDVTRCGDDDEDSVSGSDSESTP